MMGNVSKWIAASLGITSEKGVTAIEYGLLAALVALAIITAVTLVGTNLNGVFSRISSTVK